MSADIQPPDFETRVAILKKKAELDRVDLPDDVAYFIANRVKSNIRELEGSLDRHPRLRNPHRPPADPRSRPGGPREHLGRVRGTLVTIDDILRRVARGLTTSSPRISAPRLGPRPSPSRASSPCTWRASSRTTPTRDIGRGFGGKDHTTVLHAVNKIDALLQQDPKLRRTLDHIINTIRLA